eukprot:COSAG01_NODE_10233_length_2214_cov_3.079905_4_plen_57_part_01
MWCLFLSRNIETPRRGQAGRGRLALAPFPQRQAAFSAQREAKLAERRRAQEQAEAQQ